MVLYLIGCSVLAVALVFDSPALDFRLVALGAVLPLAELAVGQSFVMQTLLCPVIVLAAVMLVLRGRRLAQRRWLGIPIGLFMYLVLSGTWRNAELFWWPFLGTELRTRPELPGLRAWLIGAVVGVLALAWLWSRFDLGDPALRRGLLRTGRLDRPIPATPARDADG